jgi:hypothetical protein
VCTAYSDWRCFLIIDVLGGHGITGTPTPCFWRTFLASFCSESGSSSNVNNNANLQCLHLQIWDCLGQPSDHAILFLKHKSSNKFFSTQSHSLGSSEFGIRRFVHRAKPHMCFSNCHNQMPETPKISTLEDHVTPIHLLTFLDLQASKVNKTTKLCYFLQCSTTIQVR